MAVSMNYGKRAAMDSIPCGHATIDRIRESVERDLGFRMFDMPIYRRDGLVPTPKGRAWATLALKVYRKAQEVEQIGRGLRDFHPRPKQEPRITLDEILGWLGSSSRVVERWLHVRLISPVGFITPSAAVLKPSLDELCALIRQLYALQEVLRESERAETTQVA